jgi:uncharacterized membrane protein YbaN (DUF454 family)
MNDELVLSPKAGTVPAWAFFLLALAMLAAWSVAFENGLLADGTVSQHLHEFFHDARHFAGVPCH